MIGDGVISTDATGRVVFMNGAAEALTGWTQADAAGQPLSEVLRIVDDPAGARLVARDGSARPVEHSAAPVRNGGEAPAGTVVVFRDVAERRRAEEARAQLAAIVESSDDAIVSKNLDGIIQSWNAGARRIFGYRADEVVGRSITLLIPPERLAEEDMILGKLRRGERVEHFETVRVAKDGRRLDIALTVSPIRDSSGRIIGASKIARDITARRGVERELAAERERLRTTLASIGDGVISTDAAGRIVYLNPIAEDLTGWPLADAGGRPIVEVFDLIQEATGAPVDNPALRALAEGRIVGLANHATLRARDGTVRPIDDSAAPMRDASGAVVGSVLVFRDVSERARADEARARLAAIVESSDDAIISKSLDGIIRSWNAGAQRIFGYTAAEAVGRSITILIPPERLAEETEILARLRRGERIDHFETVRVSKDGRALDISLTVSPICDRDGRVIGASKVARDVTARRRVERELAAERERLRTTLAGIADGVISADAADRVLFMNPVAEALTGWSQGEAAGRPVDEVLKLVDGGEGPLLVARDGTARSVETSAAAMLDARGAPAGVVRVFRDVTEHRRADEARARLAAIVESSEDAIVGKTLDGIIGSWNAGAERLFGYTAAEAIGRPITMLIPPERVAEEDDIIARLRRGERIEHFETVRVGKDGRALDVSLTVSPIRDAAGRVIGASKIARDVSDRKRADRALRESEGRHRFLSELATATLHLATPDEIAATAARLLAAHLGVDRCELVELDDAAALEATLGAARARAVAEGEPFAVEDVEADPRAAGARALLCVPLRRGGALIAALIARHGAPRAWSAAELELARIVLGRTWESLERARSARERGETAARLALALDAARLGDWSWDATSELVTLSPRAAEILGLPETAPVTRAELERCIHDDDRELARAAIDRALAERQQYDVEYRVRHPGGRELWVSARGRAHHDALGRPLGMFGVVQDITEKKRLEQELRQRAAELAEADRRKDDFIALLAHELRNPLAPIRAALHIMQLAGADAAVLDKARGTMDRQLAHLVRLIDDLMDVSRLTRNKLHLQKARVALGDVLTHAVEAAAPAVEAAGHELTVSLPSETVLLDADLTRLTQVFGNLLSNSAKYTPRGGRIAITAERRDGEALVAVRDNGIGIPPESLPRVFDMFAQVDRSVERVAGGLGIGLALVKGLVEMHGGRVTAESGGLGAGSTFTVRLPVAAARADEPGAAAAGHPDPSTRAARRVMVVDDYEDGAASMADLLELLGNEVHVAYDGLDAIELAERVRPELIFMDVAMPRLNGLDATRRIRERPWGRDVVIVALSGWGQEADRARTREAGFDDHLVKPLDLATLQRLLATLPQRGVA